MQKKILHIDNGAESVRLVKTILEAEGHEVIIVCDEKNCLLKVKKEKPDLVLINVMIPKVNAWDLYQKIKKLNINTKVVFISQIPISEERKQDILMSGIADYIMEPFRKEELMRSVNAILD